jgi:hypothetical protein
MTKPQLVRLFEKHGQRITGLAILTGKQSRQWVCRDFDDPKAYENWAAEHSELAQVLPTVKTGRGYHVYFRCFGSIPTVKLGDGELRAEKSYTLLPPSLHPSGARYQWLKPLWTCHYLFYPDETGLNKLWLTPNVTHEVLAAEGLGSRGLNEEVCKGRVERVEAGFERLEELEFIESQEAMTLERAVAIAMPKAASGNHQSLHLLQRCLFTMKIQGKLGKAAFEGLQKEAFVEWHEGNRFLDPRQSEQDYFEEFIECGLQAKRPYGVGSLSLAWDRAKQAEPDEAAKAFTQPEKQRLVLLCRELQRLQGDKPFFLSARSAAGLVGVTPITASRWLRQFEALKILACVKKGGIQDKQASEFKYLPDANYSSHPPTLAF